MSPRSILKSIIAAKALSTWGVTGLEARSGVTEDEWNKRK